MASGPTYTFRRGTPVILGRRVLAGDPAGYQLHAKLKPTTGLVLPPASVESLGEFTPSFVAAVGGEAAHWLLTWPTELAPGHYCVDVRFELDADVVAISAPAWIVVTESVSG